MFPANTVEVRHASLLQDPHRSKTKVALSCLEAVFRCILPSLTALLLCFPIVSWAGQDNPATNMATQLRIGTMELAPYGWVDDSGKKHGLIYAMNQEIGKRSGLDYTNHIIPFKRMVAMLKIGKLDLISSQPHKEATEAGELLAIQHKVNVIAVTRKNSGITTIADLKDKQLLYHDLASYDRLEGIPASVFRVTFYEQMIKMLRYRDKYDAAIISEPAFYHLIKQLELKIDDFGTIIPIETKLNQWIIVHKDLPEPLKEKLRQIVSDIYHDKMYERLIEQLK